MPNERGRRPKPKNDVPLWRTIAVESLFSLYWVEVCDADNPDSYSAETLTAEYEPKPEGISQRRRSAYESFFARPDEFGIWEILFPTKQQSAAEDIRLLFELVMEHGGFGKLKGPAESAIRLAATVRVLADERSNR